MGRFGFTDSERETRPPIGLRFGSIQIRLTYRPIISNSRQGPWIPRIPSLPLFATVNLSMQASKRPPPEPSASHELVPVGPRDVQLSRRARRDDNGHLPTTARALVLRNGKYGARGTGELVATRKISGREKLDLLGGE